MTENTVGMLAGALLALLFGYAPGLRPWYEALEPTRKALVMAGALLIAALLLYGAACYTPWDVGVTCDQTGFWTLAQLFISALVANQAAYLIGVKPTRTAVEQA
jgi:multisubunit Na+/H+ antiporter MnhB subunit